MLRIDEITISNLLSFGQVPMTLKLNNLNVLIGPNGSGKSNFIEVINLLRSTPGDFQRVMADRGGIAEWYWKHAGHVPSAWIDVKLKAPSPRKQLNIEHRLELSLYVHESPRSRLMNETVRLSDGDGAIFSLARDFGQNVFIIKKDDAVIVPNNLIEADKSVLAQMQDPVNYSEIFKLAGFYRSIRIFQEWHTGSASALRKPQRTDGQRKVVEEDFSNAALALNRVRQHPAEKKKLLEYFQLVYEGVEDVDVSIDGGWMSIVVHERDARIPATRLSDGTLRYLCLLLILLDPEPPSLICIEEPEICMHPDLISTLAKLLVEASERTQLVVTTHSDILVDALTDHPESIVVCEKHDGATTMKRLDRDELATWLNDYTLGPLWTRGFLGGNRW